MFQKSAWHHPGYRTHACRVMGLEGNSSICARLECGKASLDSALLLHVHQAVRVVRRQFKPCLGFRTPVTEGVGFLTGSAKGTSILM